MEFKEVNKDNWRECIRLTKDNDTFLASNLYSIAEAQFFDGAHSRAIYADNQMVGYTMYGIDTDNEPKPDVFFINRFMIEQSHRRKGYGSKALKHIITIGFEQGYDIIETSTEPENRPMRDLLEKNGFQTNHEMLDDELVYFYKR